MNDAADIAGVRWADLTAPAPDVALSAEEELRAAKFVFAADRGRWTRARQWTRLWLGELLGCAQAEIAFIFGPHGKPAVRGAGEFEFNLSHAGEALVLAWRRDGRAVGVDVEVIREDFPALDVAEEFFPAAETAWLRTRPVTDFFRAWTAKEALMKATGLGLGLPPAEIVLQRAGEALRGFTSHPAWTLQELPAPAGHAAALVWAAGAI